MRFDEAMAARLRGVPLFRGLSREELEEVVRIGHERNVGAGELIFREGEEGREMFVVLSGGVGLQKDPAGAEPGDGWKVTQVQEGAIIGEMALLTSEPRTLTAVALASTRLMAVTRSDFERLVGGTSPMAVTLLRNLATEMALRLGRMDRELHRFYVYDAHRDRKIAEIIRLKDQLLSRWEE